MQAAGLGNTGYSYDDLDGPCLIDVEDGVIRGFVRYWLGRPETWIRQAAVAPMYQKNGVTIRNLLLEVRAQALQHGSQGVEAFHVADAPEGAAYSKRLGALLCGGTRVRWKLTGKITLTGMPPPMDLIPADA